MVKHSKDKCDVVAPVSHRAPNTSYFTLTFKNASRSTRQGKRFKTCVRCGCMANSNRQFKCKHCGDETLWSKAIRGVSSKKMKTKDVPRVQRSLPVYV